MCTGVPNKICQILSDLQSFYVVNAYRGVLHLLKVSLVTVSQYVVSNVSI